MTRRLRSVLFLPASNARAIEKARVLASDAVVLDLEDAVAPEAKDEARQRAVETLALGGFGDRIVAIRINGLDTAWGEADLEAACRAGPQAVLIPKVDDAGALAACDRALEGAPEWTRLWAMIETCRGVLNLAEIAAASASTRLSGLVLGVNDLSKEMGCRPGADRAPLQTAMAMTVTAARAHGLGAFDGVYNDVSDLEGFALKCRQGRAFGFDGKSLVHPDQIEPANLIFAPDAAEIAWARAVVEAFAETGAAQRGAIKVQGRMVERLHLEEAQRTLAAAAG